MTSSVNWSSNRTDLTTADSLPAEGNKKGKVDQTTPTAAKIKAEKVAQSALTTATNPTPLSFPKPKAVALMNMCQKYELYKSFMDRPDVPKEFLNEQLGTTLLHLSIFNEKIEEDIHLITVADFKLLDAQGKSPLLLAAKNMKIKELCLLLTKFGDKLRFEMDTCLFLLAKKNRTLECVTAIQKMLNCASWSEIQEIWCDVLRNDHVEICEFMFAKQSALSITMEEAISLKDLCLHQAPAIFSHFLGCLSSEFVYEADPNANDQETKNQFWLSKIMAWINRYAKTNTPVQLNDIVKIWLLLGLWDQPDAIFMPQMNLKGLMKKKELSYTAALAFHGPWACEALDLLYKYNLSSIIITGIVEGYELTELGYKERYSLYKQVMYSGCMSLAELDQLFSETLLHLAIACDEIEEALSLIPTAELMALDKSGRIPLDVAIIKNNIVIVNILLDRQKNRLSKLGICRMLLSQARSVFEYAKEYDRLVLGLLQDASWIEIKEIWYEILHYDRLEICELYLEKQKEITDPNDTLSLAPLFINEASSIADKFLTPIGLSTLNKKYTKVQGKYKPDWVKLFAIWLSQPQVPSFMNRVNAVLLLGLWNEPNICDMLQLRQASNIECQESYSRFVSLYGPWAEKALNLLYGSF